MVSRKMMVAHDDRDWGLEVRGLGEGEDWRGNFVLRDLGIGDEGWRMIRWEKEIW